MLYWSITVFLFSLLVIAGWYIRELLTRFRYLSETSYDFSSKVETYKEHLEAVYGLPMFYGDDTLKGLLSHTNKLAEDITELKSVFFLAEDTEGEVLSGQEEQE
jgi:protein involved in temperature-dependent protein secretion|tara:strand:+ start:6806 stop:7117 length:312 start_codon:yes stop_codon:yes gene_type:complete